MKELPIFIITAYIPSDENIVVSDIKKISKISEEGMCVIISIKEQHGIGTGLKFPLGVYSNELNAVLSLFRCGWEEYMKVDRMTLQEALQHEKEFIEKLTKLLK